VKSIETLKKRNIELQKRNNKLLEKLNKKNKANVHKLEYVGAYLEVEHIEYIDRRQCNVKKEIKFINEVIKDLKGDN